MLRAVIEYRENEGIFETDVTLRKFLEDSCVIQSETDVLRLLRQHRMDMSIQDIEDRIAKYDVSFITNMNLLKADEYSPKVLCDAYISGIRPEMMQRAIYDYTKAHKEVSLKEVMKVSREKLRIESEIHMLQMQDRTKTAFKTGGRQEHHHPREPSSSADVAGTPPDGAKPSTERTQAPSSHQKTRMTKEEYAKYMQGVTCYLCHEKGHKSTHCPNKDKKVKHEQVCAIDNSGVLKVVTIPVWIGSMKTEGMIDTCATLSCISRALLSKVAKGEAVKYLPNTRGLRLADGKMTSGNIVMLEITVPTPQGIARQVTKEWEFTTLEDNERDKLILGTDLLEYLGILTDGRLYLDLQAAREDVRDYEDDDLQEIYMDAFDMNDVMAVEAARPIGPVDMKKVLKEIDVPPSEISAEVNKVLNEYQDLFYPYLPKEGSKLKPFHIKLKPDFVPVHRKYRMLDPATRQLVRTELESWQKQGLVAEGIDGDLASPITIAEKPPNPDGSRAIRVCVDFSGHLGVNEQTLTYDAPMPNITLFYASACGKKWYLHLDLMTGYLQMLMDPESVAYTGFKTPDDYKRALRLLYGLKNAPAFFQHEMCIAFTDLMYDTCGIFIDDILGYGDDKDFVTNLRKILQRAREKNLRFKARKCVIGVHECECAGQVLSASGRRMSEKRVKAVRELEVPKTVHQLRMFLGSMNYFRDYLPDLATKAAPLSALLKGHENQGKRNHNVLQWSDECQQSFESLKNALSSETVLAHPIPADDEILVVKTDASKVGVGGMLVLRKIDGSRGDRPCTFFSATFSPTQQRWSTKEQELYGIVLFITKDVYSALLKLKPFLVETDHRNLVFLSKESEHNNKLLRWKVLLQSYIFDVKHVKGVDNVVSDTLSRMTQGTVNQIMAIDAAIKVDIASKVKELQQQALQVEDVKQRFEANYQLIDGIWCHVIKQKKVAVIPDNANELKTMVMEMCHGSVLEGHLGISKTEEKIVDAGYWWTNIHDSIVSWIQYCGICQKARLRLASKALMKTTGASAPFQAWEIDSIAMPETSSGNKAIDCMVCKFSKLVELAPKKAKEAVQTADNVVERIVLRYGLPYEIQTDNGTEYSNAVIDAVLKRLHVKHHCIMPYHPASDGIVERKNYEVERHARCLCLELRAYDDWDKILPIVQFILNHTVNTTTGFTPFEIVYGDHIEPGHDIVRIFAEEDAKLDDLTAVTQTQSIKNAKLYVQELKTRLASIKDQAKMLQDEAVTARLDKHNVDLTVYHKGDFVLVEPAVPKAKLRAHYEGPFKIVELISDVAVRVQSLVDVSDMRDVHMDRLRKFYLRGEEEEMRKLAEADSEEQEVETIYDHRGETIPSLEFHVHWKGFDLSEDTWERTANVDGCTYLEDYLESHANAKKLVEQYRAKKERQHGRRG